MFSPPPRDSDSRPPARARRYGYPAARCVLSLTVSLRPPVATPDVVAEFVAHEGALCGYRVALREHIAYHLCCLVFDVVREESWCAG